MSDSDIGHDEAMPAAEATGSFARDTAPQPVAGAISLDAIPILIVTYRNLEDVVGCLAALGGARRDVGIEVFICENGGREAYDRLAAALASPGSPCVASGLCETFHTVQFEQQCVLRLGDRPGAPLVHLAAASENLGYAGGINAWLRPLQAVSGWPAVWILNPDTKPAPDALVELAAYSRRWGKGMVGSRLVPMKELDLVHSRGLAWSKSRAVAVSVDLRASGDFEPNPEQVDERIDAPSGASMYVTRACIERIGLMDERYFLYFEDLDWGFRARHSCGVGYAHRSVVLHAGGTTIGGSIRAARRSALSVYLEARNSILFVRERYPRWVLWTAIVQMLRAIRQVHVYPISTLRAVLSGVLAGVLGRSGRPDRLLPGGGASRGDMTRYLKLLLACICWGVDVISGWFAAAAGAAPQSRLVILGFHGVPAAKRASFGRQMDAMARRSRIVAADWNGDGTKGLACAVTFDDAFVSVLENALPELSRRNIPCTIFVPVGVLGRAPDWAMEGNVAVGDVVASEGALKALPSGLVTLGAHTVSHPPLSRIPRETARTEVVRSRALLSEICGRDVTLMAFPYGDYDDAVVQICRAAGYELVYSIEPRQVQLPSSHFVRGRVSVEPDDAHLEFFLKMSGAYRWVSAISALKRRLGLKTSLPVRRQAPPPLDNAAGESTRPRTIA